MTFLCAPSRVLLAVVLQLPLRSNQMGHADALSDGNFHTKNVALFAADVDKATAVRSRSPFIGGFADQHAEIKRAVRQGTARSRDSGVARFQRGGGLWPRFSAVPRHRL